MSVSERPDDLAGGRSAARRWQRRARAIGGGGVAVLGGLFRFSGPVGVLVALALVLWPDGGRRLDAPTITATPPAAARPTVSRPSVAVAAGGCTDPAISGCTSYDACALAVTIGSGLSSDPGRWLTEGLAVCAEGAE